MDVKCENVIHMSMKLYIVLGSFSHILTNTANYPVLSTRKDALFICKGGALLGSLAVNCVNFLGLMLPFIMVGHKLYKSHFFCGP